MECSRLACNLAIRITCRYVHDITWVILPGLVHIPPTWSPANLGNSKSTEKKRDIDAYKTRRLVPKTGRCTFFNTNWGEPERAPH